MTGNRVIVFKNNSEVITFEKRVLALNYKYRTKCGLSIISLKRALRDLRGCGENYHPSIILHSAETGRFLIGRLSSLEANINYKYSYGGVLHSPTKNFVFKNIISYKPKKID